MAFQSNIDYVNVSNEQLMLYLTQGKEMAFSEIYSRFSVRMYVQLELGYHQPKYVRLADYWVYIVYPCKGNTVEVF